MLLKLEFACHAIKVFSAIENDYPSKYAISNGFAIGALTIALQDATYPKIWLSSFSLLSPSVYNVRGGRHNVLRSHTHCLRIGSLRGIREKESVTNGNVAFLVIIQSRMTEKLKQIVHK